MTKPKRKNARVLHRARTVAWQWVDANRQYPEYGERRSDIRLASLIGFFCPDAWKTEIRKHYRDPVTKRVAKDVILAFGELLLKSQGTTLAEPPRDGYCYVVGDKGRRFVKIGHSRDVGKRVNQLQVGFPYDLLVFAIFDGGRAIEARMHEAFQEHRLRGEWFKVEGSLETWLSRFEPLPYDSYYIRKLERS